MFKTLIALILLNSFAYAETSFTVGTDPIIDITSTGTGLSLGDDNMSGMKPLGFDFDFYGSTFDEVNISMNGFFTFQSNFSVPRSRNYLSEVIPATSFNYTVFPLWSDFIRRTSGNASPYIQTFGQTSDTDQYFVVMWDNVSEYSNQLKSTFQAILYEGTNAIEFRYDKIQIKTHDITIGIQGNNEALTYLRYEDTNNTTYIRTDDWSLTTAEVIDESYDNLTSECLIDAAFSTLCDIYDLSYEEDYTNEEDYLMGSGLTDAVLYGYDNEEEFYGYNEEDEYLYGGTTVFETFDHWDDTGDYYDDVNINSSVYFDESYYLEEEEFHSDTDFEFTDDHYTDYENFEEMDVFYTEDFDEIEIEELPLIEIHEEEILEMADSFEDRVEDNFLLFVEHFEEEMSDEELEEIFEEAYEEEFEEEEFEEYAETEEEEIEEEIEEVEEEEVEEVSEEEEEREDRPRSRERINNIVASTNAMINNLTTNTIRGSSSSVQNTSTSSGTTSVSSTASSAIVTGMSVASSPVVVATSPASVSNSPSISDQITSSQVQTNTVLQTITIIPMPTMDNTPSVVMAEVQVTTMENQIESMTSTMVTASEADQITEQVVASNIRSQQEQSQQQQQESGEYDTQGQATLLAYMNFLPGFDTYKEMNIPQPEQWYLPRAIYTNVTIDDNYVGYGVMMGNNINKLSGMVSEQSMELFGG